MRTNLTKPSRGRVGFCELLRCHCSAFCSGPMLSRLIKSRGTWGHNAELKVQIIQSKDGGVLLSLPVQAGDEVAKVK